MTHGMLVVVMLQTVLMSIVFSDSSASPWRLQSADDSTRPEEARSRTSDSVEVFLVISARAYVDKHGDHVSRQLEIVWHADETHETDQLALHKRDDSGRISTSPLLVINSKDHHQNYYTTSISVPAFQFSNSSALRSRCLGYGVSYWRGGQQVTFSCLRSQPSWMKDHQKLLKHFRLHQIILPGTHDSASYIEYQGWRTDVNPFIRLSAAQEESIFNQFILGVRYFDIRVAFYPLMNVQFWSCHGPVPYRPFSVLLQELVSIMELSQEIVIVEIGGFNGAFMLYPEAYNQLLNMIIPKLGRWMMSLPSSWDQALPLSELWRSDRRLLLAWDGDPGGSRPDLWPRIVNSWRNDRLPQQLMRTLNAAVAKHRSPGLWSLAAELTPDARDLLSGSSLRHMTDSVNRRVSLMVRHQWWNRTNIVMSDYFMSSMHVNTAIQANIRRSYCSRDNVTLA